jgi:ADP-ribose pyrophosphatase YjhB (NUDIX family)
MNTPKLAVTISLFTVLEDINLGKVPSALVSMGRDSSERFGVGLFVLTRRSNNPGSSGSESDSTNRVLPAMPVDSNESIEDAAHRLLRDELGISAPVRLRQTKIFDDPTRESQGRVISVTFWGFANLEDVAPVLGGRDQVGLELVNSSAFIDDWSKRANLEDFDGVSRFGARFNPSERRGHERSPSPEIDNRKILDIDYDEMVFTGWRKLRFAFGGRLDPFRFLGATALPEAFRLSDLRELQDVCRGERSQVDQFRRSILNESSFIAESQVTEERQKRPGKPATLYSLREWADPSKTLQSMESEDD